VGQRWRVGADGSRRWAAGMHLASIVGAAQSRCAVHDAGASSSAATYKQSTEEARLLPASLGPIPVLSL
jgi:hypothetical protein